MNLNTHPGTHTVTHNFESLLDKESQGLDRNWLPRKGKTIEHQK